MERKNLDKIEYLDNEESFLNCRNVKVKTELRRIESVHMKLYILFLENCSLSLDPRSKTKTTAEILLKKGQQAAEKTNLCIFICCFCKLSLVI